MKILPRIALYKKSAKGFTLIELLVVIGILGILASAMVATIDPFEQLKKGQDANVKNTAVEFQTAMIRYYITHNSLPWIAGSTTCQSAAASLATLASAVNATGIALTDPSMLSGTSGCLPDLINDGELKTGFTSVTDILKKIYVSAGTTSSGYNASNKVVVCFQPQSKAQQRDLNTKYDAMGAPATGCISQTSTGTSCYWCAQ